jgi:hypothetical protein
MSVTVALIIVLGFAAGAAAQEAKTAAGNAAIVKAMDLAMDPGEGQKRLDFLVGTFDVKIKTWLEPGQAPIEARAVAVHSWVLGHRYVQTMLSGFVMGEPFNAIGYAGFDNVAKKYVACYMDSGSTGMEWYTGEIGPDGKVAKMTATIYDAITGKPNEIEMRLNIETNGDHVTSLWQADPSGTMVKIIELQYTRKQS